MKNILFDFITLQDDFINGGNIFTSMILDSLVQKKVNIYALVDKTKQIPDDIEKKISEVVVDCFDINELQNINNYIDKNNIELVFIGVSQRYNNYDLCYVNCKIVLFCHDIGNISLLYQNKIYNRELLKFYIKNTNYKNKKELLKDYFVYILTTLNFTNLLNKRIRKSYHNFENLIKKKNVILYTVSDYSKYALSYFFDIANPINICYPPLQVKSDFILDEKIKHLIDGKKYFLLINADRKNKNVKIFMEQWDKFCEKTNYQYYAIIVGRIKSEKKNIIQLDYVSLDGLHTLYKYAFAFVYPSIAEGFGYPPLEAMSFSIPIVCSNATSLPGVYKDSVIYFNPLYPESLYQALFEVIEKEILYKHKSIDMYSEIKERQQTDLLNLLTELCS